MVHDDEVPMKDAVVCGGGGVWDMATHIYMFFYIHVHIGQ